VHIKHAKNGLTLVETVITALLVVLIFSCIILLFRSGSGSAELLARTTTLENGWQRFITAVRDDLRSATQAHPAETILKLSCSKVNHDSSDLTTHEVAYFLASDGYFWRQSPGTTRKFEFTSHLPNLLASMTFAFTASETVSISLSVFDTRTSSRIFDRAEVIKIAGQ